MFRQSHCLFGVALFRSRASSEATRWASQGGRKGPWPELHWENNKHLGYVWIRNLAFERAMPLGLQIVLIVST